MMREMCYVSYMANRSYENLLSTTMHTGDERPDRTGVGTYSLFSAELRYNLADGFPLITTKKVHFKSVVGELIWFLSGSTNVKPLQEMGIRIWNEWADEDGDLGPVYGTQWRDFGGGDGWDYYWDAPEIIEGVDQIKKVIESLKADPYGRRHLVSAWNPVDIPEMALPPCHFAFQFYVSKGKLSCKVFQRSADMFLGVPFNIASYALLTHMMAKEVGLDVGELVWTGTDVHVYKNHRAQVIEQLTREAREFPTLQLRDVPTIFDYTLDDVSLVGYDPHPAIRADVAV